MDLYNDPELKERKVFKMKKIAMLLAACLLLTSTAVYAEDAENAQPGAPEQGIVEIEGEVWRGEVTAVDEDSITLKILEYNPENPRLPAPEGEMTELPAGEQPEEIPYEDAPAEAAEDETVPMNSENDAEVPEESTGTETETALPESADGTPVEIVRLMLTEETLYYSSALAESVEAELQEGDAGEETSGEDSAETPEENGISVEHFVFEQVALVDVGVGNVLTVEVVDGAASIVVIEADAEVPEEVDM